jgi:hypothetical protein
MGWCIANRKEAEGTINALTIPTGVTLGVHCCASFPHLWGVPVPFLAEVWFAWSATQKETERQRWQEKWTSKLHASNA